MDDCEAIIGYPSVRAMLEDLYVCENLPMHDIAVRCGHSPATIAKWLRELDIPVKPRGGINNRAKFSRSLHLLDQRVIMLTPTPELAKVLNINYSTIHKYKKGVTSIWNSQLSVPQQDLNATRS